MNSFSVPVVKMPKMGKHPKADTLSIGQVFGFTVISKTDSIKTGELCIYIPVDAIVPTDNPLFAFLKNEGKTHSRIRARKIREIFSMGFVVPVPEGMAAEEGQDVAKELGITKYEPPEVFTLGGEGASPPPTLSPVFKIESYLRNMEYLTEGEWVSITEKIHGSNARYVFSSADNSFHVGSHNCWWKDSENNIWWKAARKYNLAQICTNNPDTTIYGEVYGNQDLKYGLKNNTIDFKVFAVVSQGYGRELYPVEVEAFCTLTGLPHVPILYKGPFSLDIAKKLTEGGSVFDKSQIKEGVVIRNAKTTTLKLHSEAYLLRKHGTEFH